MSKKNPLNAKLNNIKKKDGNEGEKNEKGTNG